jgi:antitoxin YefM
MKHTISLNFDELNSSFIDRLKALFVNSSSRLTIVVEDEEDETEYLLKSEANKTILLKSLENARKGNVIMPDLEEFRKLTHA